MNLFPKIHLLWMPFLLGLLSVGCSVMSPVSKIYSVGEANYDHEEWGEIANESNDFTVKVTPHKNVDKMLLFEVAITNNMQDSLFVDPQDWHLDYILGNNKTSASADTTSFPLSGKAINESYQDIADRLQKAKNGNTALIVTGIVVVVIVAIVVVISKLNDDEEEDEEEKERKRQRRKERRQNNRTSLLVFLNESLEADNSQTTYSPSTYQIVEEEEMSTKEKISYYRKTGELIENSFRGPYTIPKGETVIFGLYYPRVETATNLELNGLVGEENYSWNFQHYSDEMISLN